MAATHYQIFYRYINPNTNMPITNDLSNEYVETIDIIHQKHKLYSQNSATQIEAEQERNDMVISENSPASCTKYDMIFAFNGAKKYYHRNWSDTANEYGPEIKSMPDGIINVTRDGGPEYQKDVFADSAVFKLATRNFTQDTQASSVNDYDPKDQTITSSVLNGLANSREQKYNQKKAITGSTGNINIGVKYTSSDNMYPYVVKDCYIRVPMSPWIKGPHCGSLEQAVERCKLLIKSIGLDNIKLVKLVDITQKVKIN